LPEEVVRLGFLGTRSKGRKTEKVKYFNSKLKRSWGESGDSADAYHEGDTIEEDARF